MGKWAQFGEEEILKELLGKFEIKPLVCDIGARWKGSNAAMLMIEHGFKGRLIDCNPRAVIDLQKHLPQAEIIQTFATPENIERLVPDDCGVLSIDIDGNDYWVWGVLNKTPQIVIVEFGIRAKGAMITPYNPRSPKRKDGTSKVMLLLLGKSKGYRFYRETGANLIFVHESLYAAAPTTGLS